MSESTTAFPLQTEPYLLQLQQWPPSGCHILAQFDDESIIVYQAYNERIAKAAVAANSFLDDSVLSVGYNFSRMSWIKTNFLWMMYRAGWASKPGQERILAIRLSRQGFDEILQQAATKGDGDVRLQWDPDHTPSGEKVVTGRRAIQLGLRGEMLVKFSRQFIKNVYDITDFVLEQEKSCDGNCESLLIPKERVYYSAVAGILEPGDA